MTTLLDIQRALLARGYDIGPSRDDGLPGPATYGAIIKAIEALPLPVASVAPLSPPSAPLTIIPEAWLPWAHMLRIVVHWTAGASKASADDRAHYHLLMEGDGTLVRGVKTIPDNLSTADGVYAAHTLNLNTQSIGISLCGMRGAKESPFKAGTAPITKEQWAALPKVLAQICRRYAIPVTKQTVLSHAEVQPTLGVRQKGKWDIARLPFDASVVGAVAIGDRFRAATKALL